MADSAFVGREPELQRLRAVFERARHGTGGLVIITGEPGIGKTRLAREFLREVSAAGAATAWGRCYQGPSAPPLAAWGEALGDLLTGAPEQAADASILAYVIRHHDIAPPAIHLTGEDERTRVFDAATRILLDIAACGPLVIVIDNLHWADQISVDFLRHVSYSVPRRAIVLVMIDCVGDPERPRYVEDAISWVGTNTGATSIPLAGLPVEAVAEWIGDPVRGRESLAGILTSQTSGNPFFIEELLRGGLEGVVDGPASESPEIPDRLRHVVGQRVGRLSATAQALLHRGAVFANGFDLPVIQHLLDFPDDQILDALDEALAANLLEPMPGHLERYDFVHTIVRQCLSSSGNPSRRVRWHRQAAEAIEAVYSERGGQAAEIAVQYHRSLTMPGAINGLSHALRVVEECRDQCTPEHAVTFLRIARDLSREGPLDQQASVVGQLASAEAEIVEIEASLATLDEYLAIVQSAGVPSVDIADRLDIVARSLKYSANAEERYWRPIVERALKLVGPQDGRVWARLTLLLDPVDPLSRSGIRVGRWRGFSPEATAILRESVEDDDMARTLESFDPVTRAETDVYLTRVRGCSTPTAVMYGLTVAANHYQYRHGAFRDSRRLWQELIDLSIRAGAIHWQQQATNQLTYLLIAQGEFGEAARMERVANDLASRLGPGHHMETHQLEMATCRAVYQGGDWADIAGRWQDMLDDPALGPHDLATLSGAYYGGLAAYCAAQADEMSNARRILDLLTPIIRRMGPRDCNHNGAVAFAAGAIWRLNAVDLAPIYRSLVAELLEAGSGDYPQTSLHLALGQMSALMERRSDAGNAWTAAKTAVSTHGQHPLAPIIDFTEAESLVRWGDPESYPRIMELSGAARARFTTFEMTPWLQDLQVVVDVANEKFLRKQHLPGNVTEREADVLRLIARGLSDRQISDQLFVSPRTVNAHVRNILAKTDAANRVELAMWARNNGIVDA